MATSALLAERLIRREQRIRHLSPVDKRIGFVLQSLHTATQFVDVLQVVLDGLTDHIGAAAVVLLSRHIKLSPKIIGQASCKMLNKIPDLFRMSITSAEDEWRASGH
jgi:hypothetical protein